MAALTCVVLTLIIRLPSAAGPGGLCRRLHAGEALEWWAGGGGAGPTIFQCAVVPDDAERIRQHGGTNDVSP